jgi:hypothetical protein
MGYLREYHKHNWRGTVDYLGSYPRRSCPAVRVWANRLPRFIFPSLSGCSEQSLEIRAEDDLASDCLRNRIASIYVMNSKEAAMSTIWLPADPALSAAVPSCILAGGHRVRTTVRSLKGEGEVRAMLKEGGADPGDRLSFIPADLENDTGWRKPSPAASTCCTWRRPCPRTSPNTKTN